MMPTAWSVRWIGGGRNDQRFRIEVGAPGAWHEPPGQVGQLVKLKSRKA
jgi:hypothetical protein